MRIPTLLLALSTFASCSTSSQAPADAGGGPAATPSPAAAPDAGQAVQAAMAPADLAVAGPSSPDLAGPVDLGPGVHSARPRGTTAAALGYWEYLPPGYATTGAAPPLLVFFHGISEGGDGTTQLSRVLLHGPPELIAGGAWPTARPFVVLSPQHPDPSSCFTADEIRDFLTYALASYHVDPKRVYLTGLSCGAIGLWNFLGTEQSRVAAAVPIAGNGIAAWGNAGCGLGRVPLWAFHGDADPVVPVEGTITPIDDLVATCPSPPRLESLRTIYPGVQHDSWTRTYDLSAGHDIYTWLLGHALP